MSAISHPGILETIEAFNETTLMADPAQIVDLCRYMKETQGYVRLSAVTAVDWHPAEPRFEVVYHLHSLGGTNYGNPGPHQRVRLKCKVSGKDPAIDSVFSVWRAADWYEREIWDMFGIRFHNHPNHERILMPTDWEGHPLRKDYPVHGYKYSYPND